MKLTKLKLENSKPTSGRTIEEYIEDVRQGEGIELDPASVAMPSAAIRSTAKLLANRYSDISAVVLFQIILTVHMVV